jgi:ApaG protein
MKTLTTSGVQISVNTFFRSDLSEINASQFFFNYTVQIENRNDYSVQLISRDWYIFDSLMEARFITGLGVIGEQPILEPGESYTYTSGCDLNSEIGQMKGFYTFKKLNDESTFQVNVPDFTLECNFKLN